MMRLPLTGGPHSGGLPVRAFLLGCLLLLSACASQAPLPTTLPALPLPLQLHVQRQQAEQRQDWLLIIQQEANGLRWSMMDPLGIPQARQRLVDRQWQADGLLPPNPEARELFAALLFALTPEAELVRNYPAAWSQSQVRALRQAKWQVIYRTPSDFVVNVLPERSYHVTPITIESTP